MFIFITLCMVTITTMRVDCDVSCGESIYTENEGIIKSPTTIPGDPTQPIDCIYDIELAAKERWLRLSWITFDLLGTMPECTDAEYVEVYSGCTDRIRVARFCSSNLESNLPHGILSKERCIRIKYHSKVTQGEVHKRGVGFKATYQSYSLDVSPFVEPCQKGGKHLSSQSGIIGSPGWPDHYQEKDFIDSVCDWSIESRDENNMIQVNFFGISLTSIDYLERFDTLKMKGRTSNSITKVRPPYEVLFKGKYPPFSKNTQSSQVNVTMTIDEGKSTNWSNYVRNEAGFAFGYVVYKPKKGQLSSEGSDSSTTSNIINNSKLIGVKTSKKDEKSQSNKERENNNNNDNDNDNDNDDNGNDDDDDNDGDNNRNNNNHNNNYYNNDNRNNNNSNNTIPWRLIVYVILAIIGTVVFVAISGVGARRYCNCKFTINNNGEDCNKSRILTNTSRNNYDSFHNDTYRDGDTSLHSIPSAPPINPNQYQQQQQQQQQQQFDGRPPSLPPSYSQQPPPYYQEEHTNDKTTLL